MKSVGNFFQRFFCIFYLKESINAKFHVSLHTFYIERIMYIKEVTTSKELKSFIQFPKELYKDCPHYVPALDRGEWALLTRHPALEFCSLKLWLAYDEGKIVGRVAGIINHKCNEIKKQSRVRFGWFDTIKNIEVAKALLNQVEAWGRENQLTEICGPSRYSNMEKQAMLVEGFDETTSIAADYNYDYYPQFVESLGFEKEVDYVQYKVKVTEVPEVIDRLAERISQKLHVHICPLKNKKELKKRGREFFKVVNESYQHIFNFIPLTDKEIDWAVEQDFSVADMELINVIENDDGKMLGISFCLPSLSEAFRKAKGKLFPFGWIHVLRALRKSKIVDMYLTGVVPELIHSGIHTLYHKKLHETFLKKGYEYAYTAQQLETNPASRIWQKYSSENLCRRRCYKKNIEPIISDTSHE